MKYEKPEVEVMQFDSSVFMAGSGNISYSSAEEAVGANCSGYDNSGKMQKFPCSVIGGATPGQNKTVQIGNYTFIYHGEHWACYSYKKK